MGEKVSEVLVYYLPTSNEFMCIHYTQFNNGRCDIDHYLITDFNDYFRAVSCTDKDWPSCEYAMKYFWPDAEYIGEL